MSQPVVQLCDGCSLPLPDITTMALVVLEAPWRPDNVGICSACNFHVAGGFPITSDFLIASDFSIANILLLVNFLFQVRGPK